ncbi:MAG: hypothetical protein H6Q70_4086 [Firmicutes bacterium]|nr:hypothetical protein [Bacillota bacterium]
MFLGANYNQDEVHEAMIECKETVHKLSQEISIVSLLNPNSKQLQDLVYLYEKKKFLLKNCQKQYLKSLSINNSSTMMLIQIK